MPQVSRRKLKPEIKDRITKNLWQVFTKLKSDREMDMFLSDLLTPTEKTMLAKRLAIVLLLHKDYEYRDIHQILKVSTATITTVKRWLEKGGNGYKIAVDMLLKQEETQKLLREITKSLAKYIGKNIRFG